MYSADCRVTPVTILLLECLFFANNAHANSYEMNQRLPQSCRGACKRLQHVGETAVVSQSIAMKSM